MFYEWPPYVPVAERRRKAAAEMAKLAKKGQPISPVVVQGRAIAATAWGKAWCANMESYSDSANRLPRGRSYVPVSYTHLLVLRLRWRDAYF